MSKQVQDMLDTVALSIQHTQNDIARLRSKQASINSSRTEFESLIKQMETVNKEAQSSSATRLHLQQQVDEVQALIVKKRATCEGCARAEANFNPHQAREELEKLLALQVIPRITSHLAL